MQTRPGRPGTVRASCTCVRVTTGCAGWKRRTPGFGAKLRADRAQAAGMAGAADVDLLYWTAVSWAAAVALGKDDPELVADLPIVSALIDRALAVDEDWDRGAIHGFLVTYTMARPDAPADREPVARRHFERAVELSSGRAAAPHLAWAESVCIPREDRDCFDREIAAALADRSGRGAVAAARQHRDATPGRLVARQRRSLDPAAARSGRQRDAAVTLSRREFLCGLPASAAAFTLAGRATAAAGAQLRIATVAPAGSSFHKRLQSLGAEWAKGPGGGVDEHLRGHAGRRAADRAPHARGPASGRHADVRPASH